MRTLVEIIASFAILANGVPSVALAAAGPPPARARLGGALSISGTAVDSRLLVCRHSGTLDLTAPLREERCRRRRGRFTPNPAAHARSSDTRFAFGGSIAVATPTFLLRAASRDESAESAATDIAGPAATRDAGELDCRRSLGM
jgi:hypothetical protein